MPRQLPELPGTFVGRDDELTTITSTLERAEGADPAMVVVGIAGPGGIGKTWLALHWARQHLHRFPDGQLYVNLRCFDPAGKSLPVDVVVRGFLHALGVDLGTLPVESADRVALYRSLVAGRRMLIVLDNARDAAQVSQLLPDSASCTVLVTSRARLTGLATSHDARLLNLDVLAELEALELVARRVDTARLEAEPEAVSELIAACGGLPLAVRIVAARAATPTTNESLTALADQLRAECAAIPDGDPDARIRAVLAWSCRSLTDEARAVFVLLGVASGPDIGLPAATALTALSTERTRVLLRQLESAALVHQHTAGRYRLHDLVRLYAANRAGHELSPEARNAALRRLVEFYLHTAYAGERLLNPQGEPITLERPSAGCQLYALVDQARALEWFDNEDNCLIATQRLAATRGWHAVVWQLAWALDSYRRRRGLVHDNVTSWQLALAAAEQLGSSTTRMLVSRRLGRACSRAGLHADAVNHMKRALELAERTGDRRTQAHTHNALAWAWDERGDPEQALIHAARALQIYHELDDPVREATAFNRTGLLFARLGQHDEARVACEHALALSRQHHHRVGEADTLDSLGFIARHSGQHAEAIEHYRQAAGLYHDLGNTFQEANVRARIGDVHAELARDAWQRALAHYRAQHRHADADRVQRLLEGLDPA